jgi:PGF-CTERM protein
VVLHRGSPTGPVAGVSAWVLPGRHHNLTVYVGTPTDDAGDLVAVAHRDGDLDREFASASADPPYATSGAAVARTDFAPRLSPASTPRSPSGTTTTTTPDPTPAPPPPTTSPPPTTTTTPGFGPVAALVAALVVAALLAARD